MPRLSDCCLGKLHVASLLSILAANAATWPPTMGLSLCCQEHYTLRCKRGLQVSTTCWLKTSFHKLFCLHELKCHSILFFMKRITVLEVSSNTWCTMCSDVMSHAIIELTLTDAACIEVSPYFGVFIGVIVHSYVCAVYLWTHALLWQAGRPDSPRHADSCGTLSQRPGACGLPAILSSYGAW